VKKLLGFGLAACFFICSCSNKSKIENVVQGWWTMDTIYYKNHNIRTACLTSNSLFFDEKKKTTLPVAENWCDLFIKNSYDEKADVEVIKSPIANDTIPFRLKIKTGNEIFSGIHKIVFYRDDSNKLLKMEIYSDSLYIVCRKGVFDYYKNAKLIDELEKISWITRPNFPK
jgi:hypothetical protein